jgi:taurine--2-oxoglutarate transaminase
MSGFGRAGEWFAIDHWGVAPDLITFAKGVNSGYVPLGGVLLSDAVAASFDVRVYPGGLTYSGHPLAAASVVATLDAMESEGIVAHAARIGRETLGPGLRALADKHDVIGEVRGAGVFWAVELVADRDTRAPLPPAEMARIKAGLLERGLIPFVQDNRIHAVPPCVVTDDEVAQALAIYDDVLGGL